MQIRLGEKIRELRRSRGCTQEALADSLGVTAQAVSRWESGGSYPDMEIVPSIANYFGITIDALFGYHGDRDEKVRVLLDKADELYGLSLRDGSRLDECINLLRDSIAEFPGNEKIMFKLAFVLSFAGWMNHDEWMHYGDDGHIRYCFSKDAPNVYWSESIKIFETLISNASDEEIRLKAKQQLVELYRLNGEYKRAVAISETLPEIRYSRQIMLASATDGKLQAKYLGEALLDLAEAFSESIISALVNNNSNFDTDMPVKKVNGAIAMFELICENGDFGRYHKQVAYLYLYLSRLQWAYGQKDEAFDSLYSALYNARKYDDLAKESAPCYTSVLLKYAELKKDIYTDGESLAHSLPDDWPVWCNPDYSEVEKEIKADPRWKEWAEAAKK